MRGIFLLKLLIKTSLLFLLSISLIAQNKIHEQLRFKSYTTEDGLSYNQVNSICQDKFGRIWLGTENGINVFDGYNFKIYKNEKNNSNGLDQRKNFVYATKKGDVYCYSDPYLYKYDFLADTFKEIFYNDTLHIGSIATINEDENELLWIYASGNMYTLNSSNNKLSIFPEEALQKKEVIAIYVENNTLFLGSKSFGLLKYDLLTKKLSIFTHNDKNPNSISGNWVKTIYRDKNKNLWIGTMDNGINIFNDKDSSFVNLDIDKINNFSKRVRSVYEDSKNNLWVGTRGGLYKYMYDSETFYRYAHKDHISSKLNHNSITEIFEDKYNVLWLRTRTGGISYTDLNRKKIIHYKSKSNDDFFLNSAMINCISKDHNGNLLLGTDLGGLNILNPKTGKYTYLVNQVNNPNSLRFNDMKNIAVDKNNNYWLATYKGLDFYNTTHKEFKHYGEKDGIESSKGYLLMIDRKNNKWVSQDKGTFLLLEGNTVFKKISDQSLGCLIETSKDEIIGCFKHSESINKFDFNDEKFKEVISLSSKKYNNTIIEDYKHNLWVGHNNVLTYIDLQNNKQIDYTAKHGLIYGTIFGIIEDDSNNLWLSCKYGLLKFIRDSINTKNMCKAFSTADGLQSNEFKEYSYYKDNSGRIYFGGMNGLNVIYPNKVKDNLQKPQILFTKLKVFNQKVGINEEIKGDVILYENIITSNEITLTYEHSVFTIEFAAMHFAAPENIQYAYKLKGLEDKWNYVDAKRRFASYSSLPAGKYVFEVKASNHDGIWNNIPAELRIQILPPWWKTLWFRVFIMVIIAFGLYLTVRFFLYKEKIMHEKEINAMRIRAFTNVTHEFRTPLVLIMAPFEKLISSFNLGAKEKKYVTLIKNNIKNLNQLIDDLLDTGRNETEFAKLSVSNINIVSFLKEITKPFDFLAKSQEINFEVNSEIASLKLWFDPEKMGQIINNILTNAFKYTSPGGIIKIEISQYSIYSKTKKSLNISGKKEIYEQGVKISISDTGKGMSEEQVQNIFQRFYKINEHVSGSGIGLDVVSTLINLHGGRITVESEPDKGSVFDLFFMQDEKYFKEEYIKVEAIEASNYIPDIDNATFDSIKKDSDNDFDKINANNVDNNSKPQVLIVDDNIDLCNFLAENLSEYYQVKVAYNGAEALKLANENMPDLIVSDVIMPELNGIELCKKIKGDFATSHILVILLSTKAQKEDEISGLQKGADDYIPKPFDLQYLLLKIRNLLNSRQRIKNHLSENPGDNSTELLNSISAYDKEFIEKCKKMILDNLSNTEFKVNELCDSVGVSRSNLNRKITALTNQTPIEWIYSFRLGEAKRLLIEDKCTISEAAHLTGFTSPNSFSTVFKRKFGKSPSEINR